MRRVAFLIDGFNLYHSTCDASRDLNLNGAGTKWLDIRALCESHLSAIGGGAQVESIYYFSALAMHLTGSDPHKVSKHKQFIKCLEDTGIVVELGRFKPKRGYCRRCQKNFRQYEEKESDVAISAKLLELLFTDCCDVVVIMSGDTDIAPAVRTAQKLFPEKEICFAFPYNRKNDELTKLVSLAFKISKEHYGQYQFADPYVLSNGKQVSKPTTW